MPQGAEINSPRDTFAKAASKVIVNRGFSGMTCMEVATEAGFTMGALTHYIKSKDELLLAAFNYVTAQSSCKLNNEIKNCGALDALRRCLHWYVAVGEERKGYWIILLTLWERAKDNEELAEASHIASATWRTQIESLMQRAQHDEEIDPCVDTAKAAIAANALLQGLCIRNIILKGQTDTLRDTEIIDDWITVSLKPRQKN